MLIICKDGYGRDQFGFEFEQVRIDPTQKIRDLSPAPLGKNGIVGRRLAARTELFMITPKRHLIVSGILGGIPEVIPMKYIYVVAADNICGHVVNGLIGIGVAGIQIIPFGDELLADGISSQVLRMFIKDMLKLIRRAFPCPDEVANGPAVNFYSRS